MENGHPHYKVYNRATDQTVHCQEGELNETVLEMLGVYLNMETKRENLELSVSKYKKYTGKLIKLYENISTYDEAHLLALLEINNIGNGELVVILSGWNLKIDDDIIKKQRKLAEKYKIKE